MFIAEMLKRELHRGDLWDQPEEETPSGRHDVIAAGIEGWSTWK